MQIVEHASHGADASRAGPRHEASKRAVGSRAARDDGPGPGNCRWTPVTRSPHPSCQRQIACSAPSRPAHMPNSSDWANWSHWRTDTSCIGPGPRRTEVYFPQTAVFSMVREMADGSGVEVGTIGRDGVVGAGVLWGATSMSTRCIVQIPGRAYRSLRPPCARQWRARPLIMGTYLAEGPHSAICCRDSRRPCSSRSRRRPHVTASIRWNNAVRAGC